MEMEVCILQEMPGYKVEEDTLPVTQHKAELTSVQ